MNKKVTIKNINPSLLQNEDIDSRWLTSPFLALKQLPAKQSGKRFEQITMDVLKQAGYIVDQDKDTDYDMILDNVKTEIKGSTLIKGSDSRFSFLQIRPDQCYDQMVFSCFYFDRLEIYRISKQRVIELVEVGKDPNNKGTRGRAKKGTVKPQLVPTFKAQHGGNDGDSGTFCYHGNPVDFGAELLITVK